MSNVDLILRVRGRQKGLSFSLAIMDKKILECNYKLLLMFTTSDSVSLSGSNSVYILHCAS